MKMKIGFILVLSFFILAGCNQDSISETATVAKDYLEAEGFEVLSYEQHQEKYVLTEEKIKEDALAGTPDPNSDWGSGQMNDFEHYLGKTVDVEKFAVKNHPLNEEQCCDNVNAEEKVYTYVYVVEGEVAGGVAVPDVLDGIGLSGGYWSSLDGEIKVEMTFN
ncbi:DUF4830 domain-containing protein [Aquibacillus koreensis]|uniref:DUF4830 domain-containing protein n=1 Tax=Aquibacillus koreensis TaxID=279446 RepID=A0A9X3WQU5_9BACI|nr:DUF4830 domain-containing protein [Aquibacillus koreensis]MCT2534432.1 DUF4830 domain-containing protein [Aquibacillus koreensis]MDC3421739.1 DUF4830 domain-containing protein [Aquibacillus koreensis]